jgi:hypothetical protein
VLSASTFRTLRDRRRVPDAVFCQPAASVRTNNHAIAWANRPSDKQHHASRLRTAAAARPTLPNLNALTSPGCTRDWKPAGADATNGRSLQCSNLLAIDLEASE